MTHAAGRSAWYERPQAQGVRAVAETPMLPAPEGCAGWPGVIAAPGMRNQQAARSQVGGF